MRKSLRIPFSTFVAAMMIITLVTLAIFPATVIADNNDESGLIAFTNNDADEMTNERIVKRVATLRNSYMDIDMDLPAMQPDFFPQVKLERIRLDKEKTTQLLSKYSVLRQEGESWVCEISSNMNPDFELVYREENGKYGSITYGCTSPESLCFDDDENLQKVTGTVRSFLDELGLAYEYPFYNVTPLEKSRTNVPLYKVTVRLTLEDYPFGTTIAWTRDSDTAGNGDPTPGAFFIVTEKGEIAAAVIRNPVKESKRREDKAKLKTWKEIFDNNTDSLMEFNCTGENLGSTLTLEQAEFVLMVDAHQIAYPAWAFCFEWNSPGDNFNPEPYSLHRMFTYDARTGEKVWSR